MSVSGIADELLDLAKKESERILSEARSEADRILSDEKKRQKADLEKLTSEVEKKLSDLEKERLSSARLRAKMIISDAKGKAIEDAMRSIYNKLKSLRKTKQYAEFLRHSIPKAVEQLDGRVIVHICKGDKKLLSKLKLPSRVSIKEDLNAFGGALLEAGGGTIAVDLRLEALFSKNSDKLRRAIRDALFG